MSYFVKYTLNVQSNILLTKILYIMNLTAYVSFGIQVEPRARLYQTLPHFIYVS